MARSNSRCGSEASFCHCEDCFSESASALANWLPGVNTGASVRGELQSTPTREGDRMRSSTTVETTINGLIAGIPKQRLRALIVELAMTVLRCLATV
jgi:hypothetical protein